MSTVAEGGTALSRASAATPFLARRGTVVALALGGLLGAVGGFFLLASSDHLVDPIAYGLQFALMVVGTTAAAVYWLVRRPGNRLGLALLALATVTTLHALQGASEPLLHSIGVLAGPPLVFLTYYVVFAFPSGRIVGRLEKALLAGWVLYLLTWFLPYFFFSPVVSGGAPLAGCNAACPANALMIDDRPNVAAGLGSDLSYFVIAITSATLAGLVYRLVTASRPRRRALWPVYLPAVMLTVPLLVYHGVIIGFLRVSAGTLSDAGWLVTVGRTALPYGFLLAIVQAAFFAAAALKTIVGRLRATTKASELRTILADALDDPALELAFQLDPAGGFVDSSGKSVVPTPAPGRSSTSVSRSGDAVAIITHDAALDADPELVDVAGQALLLALENGRLGTELQTTSAELLESRTRIVGAGDAERRRLERDLHDGAQQHLVALRIKLGLASELASPAEARQLAEAGSELEEILDELRNLAHGLYPPVLRTLGLGKALASVARRSTPPATLEAARIGRYSEEVEAAVYLCCVESLQNVGKHAGAGAKAVVRLWERDDKLYFEVEDDGPGCDLESAWNSGTGFRNMRDRVASFGGTLAVESAPERGTTVRGDFTVDMPARR